MKIYEVTPNDTELIKEILKNEMESFGECGGADMWLIKSFIRYGKLFILLNEENTLLSVAQYQGVIGEKKVFLYGFSTLKKWRGKGYAKELLSKTEELLKKIEIEEILLTVDPKNIIALNLYKSLGYRKVDFLIDEYGNGVDRVLMKKELNSIK